MQQTSKRIPLMGVAILGAVVGFFLRRWQLADAFDAQHLLVPGRASSWILGVVVALVVVVLAWLCRQLHRRADYRESFSAAAGDAAVSVAGAVLLLVGCALQILQKPTGAALLLGALGIVAGLCMLAIGGYRFRGQVPPAVMHMMPCVYLVVKLIVEFKHWSVDPAVLDYCFLLFTAISAMCATYHLGGFCFGKGGRRISAFWCLTATVLTGVSLADGGLVSMLLLGGMGLWLAGNGWQLLAD